MFRRSGEQIWRRDLRLPSTRRRCLQNDSQQILQYENILRVVLKTCGDEILSFFIFRREDEGLGLSHQRLRRCDQKAVRIEAESHCGKIAKRVASGATIERRC